MEYKWKAMNELRSSLSSTNVLSKEYQSTIMCYLLAAVSEAHRDGIAEGERKANKRRDEGEQQ